MEMKIILKNSANIISYHITSLLYHKNFLKLMQFLKDALKDRIKW